MNVKCNKCEQEVCSCNNGLCSCGFNAYEIYAKQKNIPQRRVVELSSSNYTGVKCQFNGAGMWSECIYCGQYKYYATDGYVCNRSE